MSQGSDSACAVPSGDRRDQPRRRQIKAARIVYNNGHVSLDCEVRNLSDTGAQLRIGMVVELPESFSLHLQDGRRRSVEFVWRRGDLIGVRFIDAPAASTAQPTADVGHLLERIARIERELAALQDILQTRS
jgi:hypothetical protein